MNTGSHQTSQSSLASMLFEIANGNNEEKTNDRVIKNLKNRTFHHKLVANYVREGAKAHKKCFFFLSRIPLLSLNNKGQITTQSISKESHPTSQSVHHPPAKRIEGWRRCVYTIWIFNYFLSSIHRRYIALYS